MSWAKCCSSGPELLLAEPFDEHDKTIISSGTIMLPSLVAIFLLRHNFIMTGSQQRMYFISAQGTHKATPTPTPFD